MGTSLELGACAWHQLPKMNIEHVGGLGRANLMFAFPQCFPISLIFCHTYPPTFFLSAIVWSHMIRLKQLWLLLFRFNQLSKLG